MFVDDGSSDQSPRILDQLAAADRRVGVVHLSRNFGHQAAVQAGLVHCRGDAVVLMDSDLQDAPEAIGQFIAQWQAGYDVVYAIRTGRKENALKRLLFAAFHWLMSRVATVPLPADAGIFGLVDRRVARQIVALAENDRYFPGLRGWVGFRQTGVVVERNARYDQSPRVSLAGLVRLAKTAMFSFSTLPLSIFHVIGAAAMVVFLGLSGFSLFCKLFTNLGDSRLDFLRADRQLLRRLECPGDFHPGRIRDPHLRSGARPPAIPRRPHREYGTGRRRRCGGRPGGRPPLCGTDGAGRGVAARRRGR